MKKWIIFVVLAVLAGSTAMYLAGCGSSSSKDEGIKTTPITTSADSSKAASSSYQAVNLASGAGDSFINLAYMGGMPMAPALKFPKGAQPIGGLAITKRLSEKFAKARSVAAAAAVVKTASSLRTTATTSISPIPCSDGGTIAYNGTADYAAGIYNLDYTFTACREGNTQFNGTYALSANPNGATITMTNFSIVTYDPTTATLYTIPVATMTANMTFNVGFSFDYTSVTLTGNGTMSATENSNSYTLTFTNYSVTGTEIIDAVSSPTSKTNSATVNGSISESWTVSAVTYTASVSYTNFVLIVKTYTSSSLLIGLYDEEITINGYVSTNFTPDTYCFEGTYKLQTTTPIYYNNYYGYTTAGVVKVNDNTTLTFNNDGTITLAFQGGTVGYPMTESQLQTTCTIATL